MRQGTRVRSLAGELRPHTLRSTRAHVPRPLRPHTTAGAVVPAARGNETATQKHAYVWVSPPHEPVRISRRWHDTGAERVGSSVWVFGSDEP